jgi:UV DNA damage endonuclease
MSIGYACKTIGVANTAFKSCIKSNAARNKLEELIAGNLTSLQNILAYNAQNNIRLFRISSDVIPFGSSAVNTLDWQDLFSQTLEGIGLLIKQSKMRVSMHPGQYTVLNSSDKNVVQNAVDDLVYHARFLDSLHTGNENKIVLHIGGAYGNKKESSKRFITHFKYLDEPIKQRLVIENDDTSYTVADALEIGSKIGVPVVFDTLHNATNPCDKSKSDHDWISLCAKTWRLQDGVQKIHYSQQHPTKKAGSHSETIQINEFLAFYHTLADLTLDIMLEVKDKNLSAVKCILCTSDKIKITALEKEWSRYKYSVLEHSPQLYNKIRQLLRDKKSVPTIEFYTLLQDALRQEPSEKTSLNAAQHVWGYFKDKADEREKKTFFIHLQKCSEANASCKNMKKFLFNLAQKYNDPYLLESTYFYI